MSDSPTSQTDSPASPAVPGQGRSEDGGGTVALAPGYERRAVEVDDPNLPADLNHRLTEELRDIVGSASVVVPVGRSHPSHGEGLGSTEPALAKLSTSRLFIALTLLAAGTIGAIVSLSTDNWWFLALALALHALGTTIMAGMIIRMTSETERPDATTLALMEEQGIANPEERFTQILGEFARSDGEDTGSTATDVVSPGHNERTVDVLDDPATAAAEQRSSMTPTGSPSESSPLVGAAPLMTWIVPACLVVFAILIPPLFGGGLMWLTTAVVVPCCIAWTGLQVLMDRHLGPFKGEEQPRIFVPGVIGLSVLLVVAAAVVIAATATYH